MESLVITPGNKQDSKLLKSIAKKMGFRFQVLTDQDKEDIALLKAMMEGRKTKFVSKETIMKTLNS
jgi:hypothetical protein